MCRSWSRLLSVLVATLAVAGLAASAAGSAPKKEIRVALIVVGSERDGAWSQAWSEGAKKAAKDFGVKLRIVPNVVQPDEFLAQGSAFGPRGYDLVIKGGGPTVYEKADPIWILAEKYPKTTWCYAPYDFKNGVRPKIGPSNVCLADIEQQEGTFRAGLLAGLLTKTNKLGAVNGFAIPGLVRQPEAFVLGARCVNSKVKVFQKYINSWSDVALAKAAAEAQISSGADIILAATDQAAQGIMQAARAKEGVYVIPSYFDAHQFAPDVVLTSVLYNLQGVGYELIRRFVQKKLPPSFFTHYGFSNFGVGELAPFYNLDSVVPASVKAQLKQLDQEIRTGKIRIPDEYNSSKGATIGTPGSANKIDVKSLGCHPVR